ncbi:MAG: energy transducer TonB [Bacteroidetes bacterium]|nr:energy transducer TonB [Bacteroidota bacterium]
MKKLLVLNLLAISLVVGGQDMITSIELHRAFGKPLLKERLQSPQKFEDLMDHYPSSWIDGYAGTTITLQHGNTKRSAEGTSNGLSSGQKNLLSDGQIGDQLTFDIRYISKNSVTGINEQRKIHSTFTIVTDQEAKPSDQIETVRNYFIHQSFKKLADGTGDEFTGASILFTVDPQGKITNASLTQSSGNLQADQLLLKTLLSMPNWKPAQDKTGRKYAQQFVLDVVKSGC